MGRQEKVAVAMSGGVDSSVAAWLLLQEGVEAAGVTLKLYENEDVGICNEKTCCSQRDVEDAARVSDRLGIPHYVLNYRQAFIDEVIRRFIDAYCLGATPNPCIDCNKYIKFGKLCETAESMGFSHMATGHYAIIDFDKPSGRYLLKKAVDETKDQSYVLYGMTQKQLAMTRLPLGGLKKTQVREIAAEQGFVNARKHDSQDICFVPDGDYGKFIEHFTGRTFPEGNFTDTEGHILGRHRGIIRYTIGQRKGLGLALPAPMYVKEKDVQNNRVILSEDAALFTRGFDAKDVNLIACEQLDSAIRLKARIRYKHKEQWARVEMTGPDTLHIEFDEPQRAIARGQAVVLYDGDVVFGGGTIS